jgi:hypothetical protein
MTVEADLITEKPGWLAATAAARGIGGLVAAGGIARGSKIEERDGAAARLRAAGQTGHEARAPQIALDYVPQ